MSEPATRRITSEWPTFLMLLVCYGIWAVATTWLWAYWWPAGLALTTLSIALFSSLQHEVLHGHPFRSGWLSEALVFPGLTVLVPYLRFRDTHLAHHNDPILTDPYDDPESNFLDPVVWHALSRPVQWVLRFNNTLLGRLIVGPVISQLSFMGADWRAIRGGDRGVLMGWVWHVPALVMVALWLVFVASIPVWAYLGAAYMGLSILKIRTFLEHRAHERASGRTVIIEDRGLLAWIFLNNNYHVVHHMHPRAPWYELPKLFAGNRAHYLTRNDGYYYRSYGQVFRAHFFKAKDAVPHPLWPRN